MKNSIYAALIIGALCLSNCSSSDDKDVLEEECVTCNLELLGENITSEFCDNGDGTLTITTLGESEIEDLDGATFDEFIAAYCSTFY